ncbi:MAG: anti-sigma factor [Candidatus Acidiferrales bacterium]
MSMNPQTGNTEAWYAACPQYEAALEDRLDGNLGGPDAAMLSEHLKSCPGCSVALEQAAASAQLLELADPSPDPGPGFSRVLMARIREELRVGEGLSFWRPVVSLAWRFAATASLALVLLVSFELGRHSQWQPDPSIVAQNRMPELVPAQPSLPSNRDEVLLMMAETSHGKQ